MSGAEGPGMRARILDMATSLFVAQGYSGISMREIAAACGLSKAGLYYHFKDKEGLFITILSENLAALENILDEAGQQPGPVRARVNFFVEAIFTRLPAEHRAVIRLASQDLGKVSPEAHQAFNGQYQERFLGRLAALLDEGVHTGELRAMNTQMGVWALLGLMFPFFNPAYAAANVPMDVVTTFIDTVFFEGMACDDRTA